MTVSEALDLARCLDRRPVRERLGEHLVRRGSAARADVAPANEQSGISHGCALLLWRIGSVSPVAPRGPRRPARRRAPRRRARPDRRSHKVAIQPWIGGGGGEGLLE